MKFKNNNKENTKPNIKTYLKRTPGKQKSDNKNPKLGKVSINNNKNKRNELNLSSAQNDTYDTWNSSKIKKVSNFSTEDKIFTISPYISTNYIGGFNLGKDEKNENKNNKRKNIKIKIIQNKKEKEVKNGFEKAKILNNKAKPRGLWEFNIEILRQIDEREKLMQLEDEELQRKLIEGRKIKQLDDEDEGDEGEEIEKQKKQIKTPAKNKREIKNNEKNKKNSDEKELKEKIEDKTIKDSDNKKQLNRDEKLLNNNKKEENNIRRNKKLKEERDENNKKEEITLDELNILIKSAINELFLPKNVDNLVYDKIIIMIKFLSESNKKIFVNGLLDGIMFKEDVNRYNNFLSKLLLKTKNNHFINQMKLRPYNEKEYSCHCKCHCEYSKENECDE